MAEPKKRDRHYRKEDFLDLPSLEDRCNKHESNLKSKLIEIGLAKNSNSEEGTGATYEEAKDFRKGGLTFVEYKTENEANNKTTLLLNQQATPVLPGSKPDKDKSRAEVMIGDKVMKILVFRKK